MCRWPLITSFQCISFSSIPIGIFTNIGFYSSISRVGNVIHRVAGSDIEKKIL